VNEIADFVPEAVMKQLVRSLSLSLDLLISLFFFSKRLIDYPSKSRCKVRTLLGADCGRIFSRHPLKEDRQ